MSAEGREVFDRTVVAFGRSAAAPRPRRLESSPLLAAVRSAGTRHIYADTADIAELEGVIGTASGGLLAEVDGNTANQPLVRKVIARYLDAADPAQWAREILSQNPRLSDAELKPLLYAIVCGRIGNDICGAFAAGRSWAVSLQLHMGLDADPEAATRVGRYLRQMVPSAVVKVPFTPHAPHCFLVARDLERDGIPVNFTSTFSARQVVAAALLANVTLTNIFMGRLNQGLRAASLGEHVDLAAQRELLRLRREDGVKTLLIVASVREWQTFVRAAGCDVFTAPCDAIRSFLGQHEIGPADIRSQLEVSYEGDLGIAADVLAALGSEKIARLYRVEATFVEFLRKFSRSHEYREMRDGEALYRRFEEAGFGDFFYNPSAGEWQEMRKGKLPDLRAELTRRLPLDTLYTLLADADFAKFQEEMDAMIGAKLS